MGLVLSSFVLASSSMLMIPGTTQAQAQTVEPNACYPATSCNGGGEVKPDHVYTLSNATLVRLAERKQISTGSLFTDSLIAIGASSLNPYVGGAGSLVIAAINDGIGNSADLAKYALSSGKSVVVEVKENASGYPAIEVLDVYLK